MTLSFLLIPMVHPRYNDVYLQERFANGFMKGFILGYSHTLVPVVVVSSLSPLMLIRSARMMRGYQDRVLLVGNLSTTRVVMDVRDTVRAYYLKHDQP